MNIESCEQSDRLKDPEKKTSIVLDVVCRRSARKVNTSYLDEFWFSAFGRDSHEWLRDGMENRAVHKGDTWRFAVSYRSSSERNAILGLQDLRSRLILFKGGACAVGSQCAAVASA